MCKVLRFLICAFLFVVAAFANAQDVPAWTRKTPRADNNTYYYVVENAIAGNENDARNQAIARVLQNTALKLGQPVSSDEISKAVQKGTDYKVISSTFKIPINKVCEYSEPLKSGGYRVYVLCQVAVAANIGVMWSEYRACNTSEQYSNGAALVKSMFVPGFGQFGKRHYGEGLLTFAGEAFLVGAATMCYMEAQRQLDVMKSNGVSYDKFNSAKKDYNNIRKASRITIGGAAVLYAFNLYRAFVVTPNYKNTFSFEPALLDADCKFALGGTLKLKL